MGFLGFGKKKHRRSFSISAEDKNWVEYSFDWLTHFSPPREQVLVNEHYFPRSFKENKAHPDNILADLCMLLNIDPQTVRVNVEKDLRDIQGMPLEFRGRHFQSELIIDENGYRIIVAHFLLQYPKHLLGCLVYECVRIRLKNGGLKEEETDAGLFIHLAGIHLGFGVVLSYTLIHNTRHSSGGWERTWNFVSPMPQPLMAFALAEYARRTGNDEWKNALPVEMQTLLGSAKECLETGNFSIPQLTEALRLFSYADEQASLRQYDAAINALQKALTFTPEDTLLVNILNNLGYYQSLDGRYEESIPNFLKALQIDPNYGYANDNLGYALIRTGRPEEGRAYLEKALSTENNDDAYSYRNMALYYMTKNELEKAGSCFRKAFDTVRIPVDLLEFHYAEYLLMRGENEEALEYLEQSVRKGEPKAIQLWQKLHPAL